MTICSGEPSSAKLNGSVSETEGFLKPRTALKYVMLDNTLYR
jgi:hypothetical protein